MDVEIQVFGPLRVLVEGRPVELGPARRRALLAALAMEPGRVVPLDVLADRIWDGEPPASPSSTVHAYISRLRASLRSFAPGGDVEAASPLRTHAPGYVLDVPPRALDAHRFTEDLRDARASQLAGDPAAARPLVRGALALWRGDAYADVQAEFARREADRLAGLRLDAFELAAQVDLALGRHEELVAELGALAVAEPLREGLQHGYLLALYRSGRQADALRHYAVVREHMAEELGIDPGPELRALHEAILRQDADLAAPPTAPPPRAQARGATHAAPAPVAAVGQRIVGRERELARLRGALERAAAGTMTPVAVVGEAGIGKSRLLEEVAAEIGPATGTAAATPIVAWGRCWQHEGAPVLWPWLQALESLADELDPTTLRDALSGRGAGVTALVPGLADARIGGTGTPGSDDSPGHDPAAAEPVEPNRGAMLRIYAAVAAFLEAAGAARPIVLLLEDMHWADALSRELAEYLVSHVRTARLALVVTVRSPTEDSVRSGSEILTSLARSGRGERIDLPGLDAGAVAAYVADRTGSEPDPATSSALAERTGGNPFFVGELVRLLVTDVAHQAAELTTVVPDSVRDVIARRLERLTENDRTVLRVAAVVGRTFDLALLEEACGLDEDAVDEAVDLATELGIVCSEPARIGRHRFVHALTQQTLLDVTGPARVRRLHGRVAQALEARGDELSAEQAERLAFHLAASGGEAEIERAVDLSLVAAEQATRVGNFPEAESLLLRAIDLSARLPGESAPRRETAARVRLWLLYTMTYGPGAPGAAAQHERAVDLIRRYGGAREVMTVHQAMFARLIWSDDLDGVAALAVEMDAAAEAADDDLMRVATRLALAQELVHRGHLARARAEYDAIAEFGRDLLLDVPVGIFPLTPRATVLVWRAIAEAVAGDRTAFEASVRTLDLTLPDINVASAAYADTMTAFAFALLDEPETALARCRHARETGERHGLVEALMFLSVVESWARERLDPGAGIDGLGAALAALSVLPSHALRPALHGLAARVRLDAGDLDGAASDLELALAAQQATRDRLYAAPLHALCARLLEARGADAAEVEREHDAARRVATEQGAVLFLS